MSNLLKKVKIFTEAMKSGSSSIIWGTITGTIANQIDLQAALDNKVNKNGFITGATKTKITYDSKGLVTSGVDATTADISDSTNKRYVTDANLTTIGNQSGTNTGDETKTTITSKLAVMGRNGNLGQNGHTQGKTSLWTNNTAPTAVALTNTAAAFTGLGGIVAVLPTLTANNDGKLLTYQNPAATINITGRNLVIKGVWLQGAVSVILAGGPVTYAYAVAYGHTSTSLATTETASFVTATTHAPRIKPLGMDNFAVTAPAGTLGNVVYRTFDTPIVVRPGEFIDLIARNIGTVTTTGAITYTIDFDASWE